MLPTVRQLEVFRSLAQAGSFTRAAANLNMSQPALSQALASLEASLGIRLFERSRRSVVLNPVAQIFLRRVEGILADLDGAVAELRSADDPSSGQLEIACLSSIATRILPTLVKQFRSAHPGVVIRVFDDDPDGIVDKVRGRQVDLAFSCLFRPEEGIDFTSLFVDTLQFVCRRGHPVARRRRIAWDDLSGLDVVAPAQGSSIRALIDKHALPARFLRRATYEVAKMSSILDIVERSDVVSIVPALALAFPAARQRFHSRPMVEPEIRREIGLMVAHGAVLPPAARAFHAHAASRCSYATELASLPVQFVV